MYAGQLEGLDNGEGSLVKLGSQWEEQNKHDQLPNVSCPERRKR